MGVFDKVVSKKTGVLDNIPATKKKSATKEVVKEPKKVSKKEEKEEVTKPEPKKAPVKRTKKVTMADDLDDIIKSEFKFNDYDEVVLKSKTGFKIIDHLLTDSNDENPGIVLRTLNTLISRSGLGKTTIYLQIAGNIIKDKPYSKLIVFDAEKTIMTNRCEKLGIDLSKTLIIKKDTTVEKLYSLLEIIATKRQQEMDEFGIERVMENPYIVLWDSVAATASNKEIETGDDINKALGTVAKLHSSLLKVYMDVLFKYNITILAVNQIRDKIDIMGRSTPRQLAYGKSDETTPGGHAIPFYSFTYTRLAYKAKLDPDIYGKQGMLVEFNLLKSKNSETNKIVQLVFFPSSGYSDFWSTYKFLADNAVIKAGAWNKFDDAYHDIYDKTWRTREVEAMYNNNSIFREAFNTIADTALAKLR